MTRKAILVLFPDKDPTTLLTKPTLKEMQKIVGGWVEQVRVVDFISPTHNVYFTYMYINEEGLLLNLPRNPQATALYQRNVRRRLNNSYIVGNAIYFQGFTCSKLCSNSETVAYATEERIK